MRVQAPPQGRLDPDIFRDTVTAHGFDPGIYPFPHFGETLTAVYSRRREELRKRGRALPGATRALEALAGIATVQTVVTGNVKGVAVIKLEAFDLALHIDFDIGAFGSEAEVRAELVRLARRRASRKHRAAFDAHNTVVIGDSIHDVVAGRDGGAQVIAVASGRDTESELLGAGADVVLRDLSDTARLLELARARGSE
jgi:phosphoglycolate phosphatase-like HAD superfamily hydrolase